MNERRSFQRIIGVLVALLVAAVAALGAPSLASAEPTPDDRPWAEQIKAPTTATCVSALQQGIYVSGCVGGILVSAAPSTAAAPTAPATPNGPSVIADCVPTSYNPCVSTGGGSTTNDGQPATPGATTCVQTSYNPCITPEQQAVLDGVSPCATGYSILSPIQSLKCAAAEFASGWWEMIGNGVQNLAHFQPNTPEARSLYAGFEYLAIGWMVIRFIIATFSIRASGGRPPMEWMLEMIARTAMAVLIIQYIPVVLGWLEETLIRPTTAAIISLQADKAGELAAKFTALLNGSIVGGALTAIIYGITTGIAGFLILFLLTMRSILLSALVIALAFWAAEIIPGDAMKRLQEPVKYLVALYLLPIVLAVVILIGLTNMNTNGSGVADSISLLLTGLGTLVAALVAGPVFAGLLGGLGAGIAGAHGLGGNLRQTGARYKPISPTGIGTSIIGNTIGGKLAAARSRHSAGKTPQLSTTSGTAGTGPTGPAGHGPGGPSKGPSNGPKFPRGTGPRTGPSTSGGAAPVPVLVPAGVGTATASSPTAAPNTSGTSARPGATPTTAIPNRGANPDHPKGTNTRPTQPQTAPPSKPAPQPPSTTGAPPASTPPAPTAPSERTVIRPTATRTPTTPTTTPEPNPGRPTPPPPHSNPPRRTRGTR